MSAVDGSAKARLLNARLAFAGALLLATLLTVGCDETIRETLELEPRDDGVWDVTLDVAIDSVDESDARLQGRIDDYARELVDGRDEWNHRFGQLSAARESVTWERRHGQVVAYRRSAETTAENLPLFFGDLPLTVLQNTGPGWSELTIVPADSRRATRAQRRELEDALDEWARASAEYLAATRDLYLYLDRQPERAEVTVGTVFGDFLDAESRDRLGELSEEEVALAGRLHDAITEALAVSDAGIAQGPVLDELSRLVYDPFPAELRVRLPKGAIEAEGFVKRSDEVWAAERHALSEVLLSLEKRWVEPELLAAWLDASEEGAPPFELAQLAAAPRRSQAGVSAADVRAAIEEKLRPPAAYRIRWER
ncbi:MAG: hypothetical protein ACYC7A_08535 [Thermoanaerobaculia bacterium]